MTPTTLTPTTRIDDKHDGRGERERPARKLPIGAEVQPGAGVHFRIWAPNCEKLDVVFESENEADALEPLELVPEGNGYFSGTALSAGDGVLYRYRTGSGDCYPDPASRFQPQGPHGPSQVVDPGQYAWHDQDWKGLRLKGQVFYELHLGTFTPEGTWNAAAEHLDRLVELGVTAIEVMPVAEFAGAFGWGYDGVDLFAPHHDYGKPDDMRRFVDRAHAAGARRDSRRGLQPLRSRWMLPSRVLQPLPAQGTQRQ